METRALRSLAVLLFVLGSGALIPPTASASSTDQHVYEPPVAGPLTRTFDPPDLKWLAGHRGVDLAAAVGEPIHAAGAGIVAFAGVVASRPVVSVDHPNGIRTTYEPVEPFVSQGEQVERGQVIGVLHTGDGHCPESCLHWGARIGREQYLDPMRLLSPPRFRLYPPEPW